jgi:transposase
VLVPVELDRLLPEDHRARQVWAAVERLDLTEFYGEIKAEEGEPGAAATDPALLVALWVYATAEGEDSARKVARLCVEHLGYIWLCGGVSVNYHTLGDFRVAQGEKLKGLVKQGVGELDGAGEVGWEAAAQDGMRVRASAGAGSFRREGTLEKHLAEARARLVALAEGGGEGVTARQRGARLRGARERVERLEAALRELPEVRAAKPAEEREEARVSETDPEARVMRMADGGYRPAYNWQWVVDTKRRVITEVKVVKVGSDGGQMGPMLEQEEADYGRLPKQWLVDGNFVNLPVIEKAESEKKVEVLAPVPKPKVEGRDRYVPLPKDGPGVGAWRERMGTEAGKELYKQRAASVECVNAQARDRYGVYQVRVRGPEKVESVGWWVALTHDLLLGIGKE